MIDNPFTKFQEILKTNNLDAFIVTNPTNIFYLTGFKGISPSEREAILIFTKYVATLVTARLYQNEAKSLASADLKIKIADERNRIFDIAKDLLKSTRRIGFEEHDLKFGEYQELKKTLIPHLSSSRMRGSDSRLRGNDKKTNGNNLITPLVPFKHLIEDLRVIKTQDEIAKIERAQIISQKAFEELIKSIKIGQTEGEISEKLSSIVKSIGGQALAFESIIASGPHSALPHYVTGQRQIAKGDVLLLDFGTKYQNYCADLSRTIFVGKTTDQQKNIYHHVQRAQKTAIDLITHGQKASHVFNIANDIFKQHKLEKYFLHSLGHGIGLEVHEKPHLRPLVPQTDTRVKVIDEELQENMVFSVEPGLYMDWGGVRIEDLVVIKNGKAKVLGKLQEEIIEI